MTVRIASDAIHLEGRCLVEDAETLLVAAQDHPHIPIDLGGAERLHMAVVQVLLAIGRPVRGAPADPFLAEYIAGRAIGGDIPIKSA
jgi:hypothetical protein